MTINPKMLSTLQDVGTAPSGFGEDPVPAFSPSGRPALTPPSLSPAAIYRMSQQMPPQLPPTHPLYNIALSNLDLYSGPHGGTRHVTDIANRVGTAPPPTSNPAGVEDHMVDTGWQPVPPAYAQVGDVVGMPGTGVGGRHVAIYAGNGQVIGGPVKPASNLGGRQRFNPSASVVYRPPTVQSPAAPKLSVDPRLALIRQGAVPRTTTAPAPFVPVTAANVPASTNLRPSFLAPMDTRNPHKPMGATSTVSSPRAPAQPTQFIRQPQKPLTTAFGPSPLQRLENNVKQFGHGIADFSKLIVSPKFDPKNVEAIKNNEQFQVPFQSLMGLLSSPYQLLVPVGAAIAKGAHAVGIPVSQETMEQANANSSFTGNVDNMFGPMLKHGIVPDWMNNRSNDQIREDTRRMTDAQLRKYAADRAFFLDNGASRGPTADQVYRQITKIRSGTSQDIPIYRKAVNEAINYPGNFSLNALLAVEGLHGALESGANIARSGPMPTIESIHGQPVPLDVEHSPGSRPGAGAAEPPKLNEPNIDNSHEAPGKPGASPVLMAVDPTRIINQSLQGKFGQQGLNFLSLLPKELRASLVDKIVKGQPFTKDEQFSVDKAYTTMYPGIKRNSNGNFIRLDKALDDARLAYMNGMRDVPHPWGLVGTNGGMPFARQALGDFGEEFAVEHLTKMGYTEFGTVKNASGQGIDLIAKNPEGNWMFLEVKTSPREISGGLSKDQRDIKSFVEDRLNQAEVRAGKWSNATDQTRDYAKMLRKEIDKQKEIQGYKVNVHAVKGKPGQFEADLVQWHK